MNDDSIFDFFNDSMLSSSENQEDFTSFLNEAALEDLVSSVPDQFELESDVMVDSAEDLKKEVVFAEPTLNIAQAVNETLMAEQGGEEALVAEQDSNVASWTVHSVRPDVWGHICK